MRLENLTNSLPKLNTKTGFTKLSEKSNDFENVKIILRDKKPLTYERPAKKMPRKHILKMMQFQELINKSWILTFNFADKKQKLINELSKVCDKNFIAHIEKADDPIKLTKILLKQEDRSFEKYLKYLFAGKFVKYKKSDNFVKPVTLDMEQIQYKLKRETDNFILAKEKALHVPSKKPQVIAIENILKEQYGCKFVSLKDNEKLAKNILKAYETASKNGVKTPKNVIVSNFISARGEHLRNDTILLKNHYEGKFSPGALSTTSDLHEPLHEILHGTHPNLLSFSAKKIPAQFKKVKRELSLYSAAAQTHETFAELYTKKLIDGLKPEEQALFDFLNILK